MCKSISYLKKKFADWFDFVTFVQTSYFETGMGKFQSSQSDESSTQSADSSKACSKHIAYN